MEADASLVRRCRVTSIGRKGVPEDPGLLHIYGQSSYHDEAYVVGNAKGLKAARDAIDRVLNGTADQTSTWVSVSDGEGYDLMVLRVDDPWSMNFDIAEDGEIKQWRPGAPPGSRWDRIAYPYTDEDWGKEKRSDALWPWKFWKYDYTLPPTTGTIADYMTRYLQADVSILPLVDEGIEVECPLCGKTHGTCVLDGNEGERLLIYRCPETNGENELVAGFSEGEKFRLAVSLLQKREG
jgi:hypothetical protein